MTGLWQKPDLLQRLFQPESRKAPHISIEWIKRTAGPLRGGGTVFPRTTFRSEGRPSASTPIKDHLSCQPHGKVGDLRLYVKSSNL